MLLNRVTTSCSGKFDQLYSLWLDGGYHALCIRQLACFRLDVLWSVHEMASIEAVLSLC